MELFKYKIIRYHPYTSSDEFLNIGFWLWREKLDEMVQVYISDEHLRILERCTFVNVKLIREVIKRLKLETNENNWYGNHFRFSEFDVILHDNLESAKDFLYYEKIGEKFENIK